MTNAPARLIYLSSPSWFGRKVMNPLVVALTRVCLSWLARGSLRFAAERPVSRAESQ